MSSSASHAATSESRTEKVHARFYLPFLQYYPCLLPSMDPASFLSIAAATSGRGFSLANTVGSEGAGVVSSVFSSAGDGVLDHRPRSFLSPHELDITGPAPAPGVSSAANGEALHPCDRGFGGSSSPALFSGARLRVCSFSICAFTGDGNLLVLHFCTMLSPSRSSKTSKSRRQASRTDDFPSVMAAFSVEHSSSIDADI